MKTYTCAECGKGFTARQQAKYCSPACKSAHQNHKIEVVQCINCGRLFEARKNNKAKFCSHKCVVEAHKKVERDPTCALASVVKPRKKKKPCTRVCIDCGRSFETLSTKVVNRRCPKCLKWYKTNWAYGAGEALPTGHIPVQAIQERVNELGIAKEATEILNVSNKPNMTREEHNARRRAYRAQRKALGLLPPERDRTMYRNKTLNRLGARCVICGWDMFVEGLQVHHIDRNRENNSNKNLVVLCANCHTVLHHRIKKNLSIQKDKTAYSRQEYYNLMAEVKERKITGKPDRAIRPEGPEESESGATHSSTSRPDMNYHEAVPSKDEKIC